MLQVWTVLPRDTDASRLSGWEWPKGQSLGSPPSASCPRLRRECPGALAWHLARALPTVSKWQPEGWPQALGAVSVRRSHGGAFQNLSRVCAFVHVHVFSFCGTHQQAPGPSRIPGYSGSSRR